MTEHPSPQVAQLMAGIVDDRARMWALVSEVVSRPDTSVAQRLTSGAWVEDMQRSVQWLGDAAERFRPGLVALGEAADAAPVTLESLLAGFDDITSRERTHLAGVIDDLLVQLAAEKRSWSGGDHEHAKTLRLAQHDQLHKRMVPAVQQWCYDALNQQSTPVLSALAKVLVIVLGMETGRDFERAVEGEGFHITDAYVATMSPGPDSPRPE
ncbi:hypothetical protein [Tessaracoccus antarcticus]|uniref:Uncharacterized protein n=1 Tax=Tessaracoccus antarcticus TaxID=2479848 RepID=A0A3M0G721_9ACTN|nr:hypothetical protein [Tessaracoccus antarcticus]RMB59927.1 hypothetical protein EAX62_09355 [Tessaracoccus antarcticus]